MSAPTGSRIVTIQTLLVALSTLAILPLIVFALWLLHLVWQNGQDNARRDLQQMAATLAVALDREVAGSIRELERIADFPNLVPGRFGEFHAYARELVTRNDGWNNLTLTAADGTVVLNAALPFDPPPNIVALQPHHREVLGTRKPAVSDIYQSRRTGQRSIGVSVPVIRDGEVRWVLSARLNAEVLSRFVGSQIYREGALASVIDRNQRVIARSRDAARFFGQEATADLRAAVADNPPGGTRRLTTLDGSEVLAAWERMPSGWTVAIGVPVGFFDAPLRRSLAVLLAFGLSVLLAGVTLSVMLGRRITVAVDLVARDARSLAAGEPLPVRQSSIRQVKTLFESLRDAASVQRDKEFAREQAVEALREADRRKDEFLAMLAHELRNPLAPLRNAVGVLSRTVSAGTPQSRVVEMCERQIRQLTRLVDDLLDVSRITQGKIALQRVPVAVCDVVAEAADAIRPMIDERRQRLAVRLPPTSPMVLADSLRLAQVLENLLSNASKYTDSGGAIAVEVDDAGDDVEVRVRDTGIGLPVEQLDRVFDLFTQVDASRERAQGGLGIGLSLVKRLVELHGGTVSAHSDGPGRGATFVVRLPRARATVEA